jgi:hypothetical protein
MSRLSRSLAGQKHLSELREAKRQWGFRRNGRPADQVSQLGRHAFNYLSTFWILGTDYVHFLKIRSLFLATALLIAGFLYPLPFVALAAVVHALLSGHETLAFSTHGFHLELGIHTAFLCALTLLVLAFLLKFFAGRYATSCGLSWQTSIFWRSVSEVPRLAKWTVIRAIPLPLRSQTLVSRLLSMSRSAFVIHRGLALGLEHVAVIMASLLLLAWLNVLSVIILLIVATLFVPFYSRSFRRLTRLRSSAQNERRKRKGMLEELIGERLLSSQGWAVDRRKLDSADLNVLQPIYGLTNFQLYEMNIITLLVGLQAAASITAVYFIEAMTLSEFSWSNLVFLVALLVLMRSFLSLMALASRLSRGYTGLAVLRHYMYPRPKPSTQPADAPKRAQFVVATQADTRLFVAPGRPVFVLAPGAAYGFELLDLTNALIPIRPPQGALDFLVWFDTERLDWLLDGHASKIREYDETVTKQGFTFRVPIVERDIGIDRASVVALSVDAWHHLQDRSQAAQFCASRIVFVVMATEDQPRGIPEDADLVITDGARILDVGLYSATYRRSSEQAFRRTSANGAGSASLVEDDELDTA